MSFTRVEVEAHELNRPPYQDEDPNITTTELKTRDKNVKALVHKRHMSQKQRKLNSHISSTFTCLDGGEWWIRSKEQMNILYNALATDIITSKGLISVNQRFPDFVCHNLTKAHPLFPLYLLRCKRMLGKHQDQDLSKPKSESKYTLAPHLVCMERMFALDTGECMAAFDFDLGIYAYDEKEILAAVRLLQKILTDLGAPKELTVAMVTVCEENGKLGIHIYFPWTRYFIEEVYWIRFIAVSRFRREGMFANALTQLEIIIDKKIYTGGLRVIAVQKAIDCDCKKKSTSVLPSMKQRKRLNPNKNTVLKFVNSMTASQEDEQQTELGVTFDSSNTKTKQTTDGIESDSKAWQNQSLYSFMSEKDRPSAGSGRLFSGSLSACSKCKGAGRIYVGRRYMPRFEVNSKGEIDNSNIQSLFLPDPKIAVLTAMIKAKEDKVALTTAHQPLYHELRKEISALNLQVSKLYPGLILPTRPLSTLAANPDFPHWKDDIHRIHLALTMLDLRCTFTSRTKFPHTPFIVSKLTARPDGVLSGSSHNSTSWPDTWILFCNLVIDLEKQTTLKTSSDGKLQLDTMDSDNDEDELKRVREMQRNARRKETIRANALRKKLDDNLYDDFKKDSAGISISELMTFSKLKEFRKRSTNMPASLISQQKQALETFINAILPKANDVTSDHAIGARRVPQWALLDVSNVVHSEQYNSTLIVVRGDGSHYCTFNKDYHESNHIFFILRSNGRDHLRLFQYCHNEECKAKSKKSIRSWRIYDYKIVGLFAPLELGRNRASAEADEFFR